MKTTTQTTNNQATNKTKQTIYTPILTVFLSKSFDQGGVKFFYIAYCLLDYLYLEKKCGCPYIIIIWCTVDPLINTTALITSTRCFPRFITVKLLQVTRRRKVQNGKKNFRKENGYQETVKRDTRRLCVLHVLKRCPPTQKKSTKKNNNQKTHPF